MSDSCDLMGGSLPGSSVHGILQAGCHFLLQGIFPTQESNLHLLLCRQILYRLSYEENSYILQHVKLQNITPSGRSQSHSSKCCIIPFMSNIQNRSIDRDRTEISGWLQLEGSKEWVVLGARLLLEGRKCSKLHYSNEIQLCEHIKQLNFVL